MNALYVAFFFHQCSSIEDDMHSDAWWPRLHSFCIGLEGSPDLRAAREVRFKCSCENIELFFFIVVPLTSHLED